MILLLGLFVFVVVWVLFAEFVVVKDILVELAIVMCVRECWEIHFYNFI